MYYCISKLEKVLISFNLFYVYSNLENFAFFQGGLFIVKNWWLKKIKLSLYS